MHKNSELIPKIKRRIALLGANSFDADSTPCFVKKVMKHKINN